MGGSITNGSGASTTDKCWRALVTDWLPRRFARDATFHAVNAGVGGTPSWYGLARLQVDVIDKGPEIVTLDFAVNDTVLAQLGTGTNKLLPAAEALVRRIRTALPNAVLLAGVFSWPDNYSLMSDARRTSRDAWKALAAHYSIPVVDEPNTTILAAYGATPTDAQTEGYFAGYGDVHPNDLGHSTIAAGFEAALPAVLPTLPAQWSGVLPERIYSESADFEETPQVVNGASLTRAGTWTVDSTSIQSATANSTASWTGTCCSFGLDSNFGAGAGVVSWSLDGGAETQVNLAGQPVANNVITNFERGEHTITLKVISGTVRVNRLLAI